MLSRLSQAGRGIGRNRQGFSRRKNAASEDLVCPAKVGVANGKTTVKACKDASITKQTYYRWRKEYGGLQVDQAKRLKELEAENAKLKRLVAKS